MSTVLVTAVVGGACAGENLFSLAGRVEDETAPTVNITAPGAGVTVAPGDSVFVSATMSSSQGIGSVTFEGLFTGGGAAFVEDVVSLPNPKDTTLTNWLQPSGAATGAARIIVKATDILGGVGADTVEITVGP